MLAEGNIFTLTVHNCNPKDAGEYRAVIFNGIDRIEQEAHLHVKSKSFYTQSRPNILFAVLFLVKPIVEALNSISQQSCVIGQDARIMWKFTGAEKPQVSWCFNGQLIPTNDRFELKGNDDGESTLTIKSTRLVDGGIYIACASNSVGAVVAQTTLSVVGVKPVIIRDLDTEIGVARGRTMSLNFVANGCPEPTVVWMRGDTALVPNKCVYMNVTTTHENHTYELSVLGADLNDQGEYSAKIENMAGLLTTRRCRVIVFGE
jgi:hypothetical protein